MKIIKSKIKICMDKIAYRKGKKPICTKIKLNNDNVKTVRVELQLNTERPLRMLLKQ